MQRDQFRWFHRLRVRYSEIDAQNVVFNAHYLTWFDVAITEALRPLEWNWAESLLRTGCDFHLVKSLVEYRRPIKFDDEVDIGVRAAHIGRSSLSWELGLFVGDDFCASGEVVWVYTDLAAGKSVPLPDEFRAFLQSDP